MALWHIHQHQSLPQLLPVPDRLIRGSDAVKDDIRASSRSTFVYRTAGLLFVANGEFVIVEVIKAPSLYTETA